MLRTMLTIFPAILACFALALPIGTPPSAQVQLPGSDVDIGVPPVGGVLGETVDRFGTRLDQLDKRAQRQARSLLRERNRDLSRLLRQNREVIERDADGDLARRGVILGLDLDPQDRAAIAAAGYMILGDESIDGLDMVVTRIGVRPGQSVEDAEVQIQEVADAVFAPDNLHFQSGEAAIGPALTVSMQAATRIGVEVGVIDGAPGTSVPVLAKRGFARGAPASSDHGSAVASLLKSVGVTRIRVADVYGDDPAGGNALAIARALGWLTASGSRVVTISLVGPRNHLVERAVNEARARGVVIVAAVGNDGPAAPPAFPASYEGVVAVTGVDRRNRALIEAGRALHLDYAAPGDRVYALNARGALKRWRGTSYATPLVAARIAAGIERGRNWRRVVDAEARDLGPRGTDDIYGRGLLCESCGLRN